MFAIVSCLLMLPLGIVTNLIADRVVVVTCLVSRCIVGNRLVILIILSTFASFHVDGDCSRLCFSDITALFSLTEAAAILQTTSSIILFPSPDPFDGPTCPEHMSYNEPPYRGRSSDLSDNHSLLVNWCHLTWTLLSDWLMLTSCDQSFSSTGCTTCSDLQPSHSL